MRCKSCGQDVPGGIPYCPKCGAYLRENLGRGGNGGAGKPLWLLAAVLLAALIVCIALGVGKRGNSPDIPAELEAVNRLVKAAEEDLLASNGILPEENIPEALERVYEAGKSSGETYSYVEKNEGNVTFGMPSGGTYVYLPPAPAGNVPAVPYLETPATVPTEKTTNGGRIATITPFQTSTKSRAPMHYQYADAAAGTITAALPSYTFLDNGSTTDDNRDDGEVTLGFLKTLSAYSVVIWHGHGGYSQRIGSFLSTVLPYDASCDADYLAGRLVMCSSGYGVTPSFFSHYLGQNPNMDSVIYLATCHSADDRRLIDSLLGRGFDCVIANQSTILTTYNLLMEYTFYAGMAGRYGTFFTAGDALRFAQDLYGETDPVYGGRPQLFGDPDVCFARNAPAATPSPTAGQEPPSPTPAPTNTPTPAPTAPSPTDVGRADADYEERRYLAETRNLLLCAGEPWTPPVDRDIRMCAGVIQTTSERDGTRFIEVDYARWNTVDSEGVPTLLYANRSPGTYVLPLEKDCVISIPWPDRTSDSIWERIDDDRAKASAFYEASDWRTLCRCYAQVTDPGESWSQPTYFFLALNGAGEVTCIWEDVYFYVNN